MEGATAPSAKERKNMDYNVISFTNIDSGDFTGRWDSKPYTIKAGETKAYPEFLAKHFAKHLTDRILRKEGFKLGDKAERAKVLEDILGEVVVQADVEEDMREGELVAKEVEKINEELVEKPFAELEEEELEGMSWDDLRSHAKDLGISSYKKSREELEAEIRAI